MALAQFSKMDFGARIYGLKLKFNRVVVIKHDQTLLKLRFSQQYARKYILHDVCISHVLMRVLGQSEFQSLNCKSEGILSNLPLSGLSQGSILVIYEINDQNTEVPK